MGGKRPGAGRPKGSVNKVTAELRREIADSGETPLEYMLRVMRDPAQDDKRRDEMARSVAPYVHPRLQATQISGDPDNPLEITNRIERIIVGSTGDDAADRDAEGVPTTH